jgi:Flp pilus assembly pilin Flp
MSTQLLGRALVGARVLLFEVADRIRAQRGATAVEYALMLALIAGVIIVGVTILGQGTNQGFEDFSNQFT